MSGKKNIVSIAQLGLAWGLKETRALLNANSDLKQNENSLYETRRDSKSYSYSYYKLISG